MRQMEIFVLGNYIVFQKQEGLSQEIEEIEAGRGDRCEEKMIMGHKNWNAKKEDEKMPTLLDFQGLMRECQKEYLVHLVLKGQFQRISRRSWVTERLTARCRSNGQFAIPLISDIDLQQFLDTWPRNMERNICKSSGNLLLNNQYL